MASIYRSAKNQANPKNRLGPIIQAVLMTRSDHPAPKGIAVYELILLILLLAAIAFLIVPIYSKAVQTATQKCTLRDMVRWSNAISAYISDNNAPPSNPAGRLTFKKLFIEQLVPYLEILRIKDWWGNSYFIYVGKTSNGYGIRPESQYDFCIISFAKEGIKENWIYDGTSPLNGLYKVKMTEDFEKDIVIYNGRLVRGPE